jgi:peptidoglycan-associated lipoprotein
MHSLSRPLTFLGASVAVLTVFGCAHEEKVATTEAPAPIVAKAEPAPPDATAAQKDDASALNKLLTGPIAYFDFDKATLTAEDQAKLRTLAQELKAHPNAKIRISGNTDEVGTEEYNLALGQRRADVARAYLIALGVDGSRIDTVSYGENRPAVEGTNPADYAKNRRDEAETVSTR